jgi:hypothetical protein
MTETVHSDFKSYCRQFKRENSPRGDFVRDILVDPSWPGVYSPDRTREYLTGVGASEGAMVAFEILLAGFHAQRRGGMSPVDRARVAGRASQARKTPEEQRAAMRRARLSAAVNTVADSVPELSPEQIGRLRAALGMEREARQ